MQKNNFKKIGITLISSAMLAGVFITTDVSANENNDSGEQTTEQVKTQNNQKEKNDINQLQDEINNNVSVDSSGHYNYSYDNIKGIVDSYNFEDINKTNGTNYTTDSFLKEATDSLNNTVIPQKKGNNFAKSSKGVNKTVSGWNYTKVYRTHSKTATTALQYSQAASNWGTAGSAGTMASSLLGPYSLAASVPIGSVTAYKSWYWSQFSSSLSLNNGKKGTISTVNRFTTSFNVTKQ